MTSADTISVSFRGHAASFHAFDKNDYIHAQLLKTQRFYEEDLLSAIYERHLPGMVLLDIGANIGNHSLFYANVLGGKVIAYEADPTNYKRLSANVVLNQASDHIHCQNTAIGERAGKCKIFVPNEQNRGMNQIVEDANGDVEVKRIDDFTYTDPIGFIKIDVEGFEIPVLTGAAETIAQHQPYVFVEARVEREFYEVAKIMTTLGYYPSRRYCYTPTYLFEPLDMHKRMAVYRDFTASQTINDHL